MLCFNFVPWSQPNYVIKGWWGESQVCTKMPYHRESFRWAYINVFLSKIQSWLKESGKTSSKQSHCGLGSKVKGCGQSSCKGKHRKTFVAGWDISLLSCVEYSVKHSGQLRKTRGAGGLRKRAGKVTPGRKAKLSVFSQLPFNTLATSALAPSECGWGLTFTQWLTGCTHVTQQTFW